jgi:predicted HTH transcriptional regulator
MKETDRIELKEQLTPDLEKEAVAFLNAKGGHIYVGVKDDGSVVGVQNPDELQLKIKDRLINNIRPSIMGLFEVENKEIDGKDVVVVGLASGVAQPYYIKQKGRSEAGCFVRIGTSSQPMTEEMIDKLLSKRLPVSLLNIPSRTQNLKFGQLKIYYETQNLSLNKNFAENLKFLDLNKQYNEIAYLFADNNNVSIRFAKWLGKKRIDLLQNEELGNKCLITAMNSVIERFGVENITLARKTAKQRIEKNIVDEKALRESIINAFAHNDYSEGNTPIFEVFEDRFEITTYGNILSWMTKKEFFTGISRPKNPEIMRIFRDLEYVENLGSGIPYIVEKYGKKIFDFSQNVMRISFPFDFAIEDETTTKNTTKTTTKNTTKTNTKTTTKIIEILKENPNITANEIADAIGITRDGVFWHLKNLVKSGQIRHIGPTNGGHWKVLKK